MPARHAWARRTGVALALALASAAHWPAMAQETDAPPLEVPDLTVTAEDPLEEAERLRINRSITADIERTAALVGRDLSHWLA